MKLKFTLNSWHIAKHMKKSRCHKHLLHFCIFSDMYDKGHIIKHDSSKNDNNVMV
jgi:hypothetical protein